MTEESESPLYPMKTGVPQRQHFRANALTCYAQLIFQLQIKQQSLHLLMILAVSKLQAEAIGNLQQAFNQIT